MLKRKLQKFLKYILISNFLIAIAATCFTLESYVLMGEDILINYLIILVFFSTLFIYNFHHFLRFLYIFTSGKLRQPVLIVRQEWTNKKAMHKYALSLVALIGVCVSLFYADKKIIFFLLLLALISVCYSVPILGIRLREIPILKTFFVAVTWGLAAALLPVIEAEKSLGEKEILMVFSKVLFAFSIIIPFEIRDIEIDAIKGIKTIPVITGVRTSKYIAYTALLISVILSFISAYYLNDITLGNKIMFYPLFLSGVITAYFIEKSNFQKSNYYYLVFVDGTIIIRFILILIFILLYELLIYFNFL